MEELFPILWDEGRQVLVLLDQTRLPNDIEYVDCVNGEDVFRAIRDMIVRGAPAIGVTAAYGLYLATRGYAGTDVDGFLAYAREWVDRLGASRPTAVNLTWALKRVYARAANLAGASVAARQRAMLDLAREMHAEDEQINRRIGESLLTLLKDGMGVLTHCNAGQLATTRYGTATSPMYLSKERGWHLRIYADETRPRLQGATLTALELYRAGLDVTLLCDTMTAAVMAQGKIDAAIVGTDRVAANGDVANKIGTLGVAILAKHFGVPFYVAAPLSSIDISLAHGGLIPIEERHPDEVVNGFGRRTAPEGVKVYNPSFDVTPNDLITAIVTEKGILRPPYGAAIARLFAKEESHD